MSINVLPVYYSIEMKSFIQGLIDRVSSSVKSQTAMAVAIAPPVLGRWGIQYDKNIIDRKIIQANEDHCGCCVVAPKKEAVAATKNSIVAEVRYEKGEEYLVPYVM